MRNLLLPLNNPVRGLIGLGLAGLLSLTASLANATEIQEVTSPGGIKAWLVEDHTVPIVALDFAMPGGSSQDPDGKSGLTNLLSATLDEGAGDLDSSSYQARLEDLTMSVSFGDGRDAFYGSLRTLAPNVDEAFDMLHIALTEPRFDEEAVERMKRQIIAGLRNQRKDPDDIASKTWSALAFPGHPYSVPSSGTEESVSALTPADLKAQFKRLISQENIKIGVVGAIDAETLGALLDKTFGDLPAKSDLAPIAGVTQKSDIIEAVELDVPQTAIQFGYPALKRDDPDFMAAYVMNHILGGGIFTSWLYEEIREKRGLAYSVGTSLATYDHTGVLVGHTGTRADKASETVRLIAEQFQKMAEQGPSEEELQKAKNFITGSYPLRFDTSGKIANQLVAIQLEDLGIDYIDRRNSEIEAITLDDVNRVAKRLLAGKKPLMVVVGPKQK